ncbi:MAG: hypothetical protein NWE96_12245 [Candidatus Bathyarchaeota archaeon]|nr:hypothetical protein [Candidatus Bathyarchaeota archaeon]
MAKTRNALSLFLVVILAAFVPIMSETTNAQSIPNLSPPQFTVKFVDRSYDVPVTTWTTTDAFTGQQVTKSSGGNYVENRTIDVVVTNQPFAPITLDNGTIIQLYYSVRTKGHFEDWSIVWSDGRTTKTVLASNPESTTIITLILDSSFNVPNGGKEDFQVKAVAGYYDKPKTLSDLYFGGTFHNLTESDWTDTQTITIGQTSAPSPSVPEYPFLWTLPLLVVIPLITLFFMKKRILLKAYN